MQPYSYFPTNYQPIQYATQPQQSQQIQQSISPQPQMNSINQLSNNGIIWVQGEAGAKSYLVAPNNTVQLWDSENPVIYLKSSDTNGMPSMKILDYTIRDDGSKKLKQDITNDIEFATKDDIKELKDELSKFKNQLQSIKSNNNNNNRKSSLKKEAIRND